LSSEPNVDEIAVRATNIVRTQESARSVLSGLYKSLDVKILLNIHPRPLDSMQPPKNCPRFKTLYDYTHLKSSLAQNLTKDADENRKDFAYIAQLKNSTSIRTAWDYIIAFNCTNQPTICLKDANGDTVSPEDCLKDETVEAFEGYSDRLNALSVSDKEFNKLGAGLLVSEVLQVFGTRESGEKMHVYSAHDYTVTMMLGALHSEDMRWPSYGASLVFELIQNKNSELFVRVYYNNEPLKSRIKGCEGMFYSSNVVKNSLCAHIRFLWTI
jgi:hypothetical protein